MAKKKYIKDSKGVTVSVTTDTLGLEKPLLNENYDINVHNRNMDKIDEDLKPIDDSYIIELFQYDGDTTLPRDYYTKQEADNKFATKREIGNIDFSGLATKEELGSLSQLQTTNKFNLVSAINEVFQNANNGKKLIASAIGEPLNSNNTFSAMSNDINSLLSTFKVNMMNKGVAVESKDKFKTLIDKIVTITGGGNKGIKYAEGVCPPGSGVYFEVTDLDFEPSLIVFATKNDTGNLNGCLIYSKLYSCSAYRNSYTQVSTVVEGPFVKDSSGYYTSGIFITKNGFEIYSSSEIFEKNKWYAIGVGEEDTTYRDSLASILQEAGVYVTPEDDMATLIVKIEELITRNKKLNKVVSING
ncbi:MAG: hypothetical protein J6D47_13295 [Peptostreptococcaceae bacterium]|nr:hypothetical protein [Peptostreptococcaceae bacterium]